MKDRRKLVGAMHILLLVFCAGAALSAERPRLILQITIDGMRTDLLTSNMAHLDGGLRWLMDTGTFYANARYGHANTETIVGHATLATGAHPAVHGMTGNVWLDTVTGELAYNVEDPSSPILPTRRAQKDGEQLDPAQQLSRTDGRSPRALLAPTIADSIALASDGRAKVFGISGKDRSAIAMAGYAGKAFWFSTDSGDFVTSSYYYDHYPRWVSQWNGERKAEAYAGTSWTLSDKPATYRRADLDDRHQETDLRGFGRTFPHQFGAVDSGLLPTQLIASPMGDVLLTDFVRLLIEKEALGQDAETDYLSVSFSGVDAVNHFFGPASLETEDAVRQLDGTLGDLLNYVDRNVGLANTLVVLSADHGAAEMPETVSTHGIAAERLYPEVVIERANTLIEAEFGISSANRGFFRPYLYLDEDRLVSEGADFDQVVAFVAGRLTRSHGIHLAIGRAELTTAPSSPLIEQIRNNDHPERSGHIYVVQSPYWFNSGKGPVVAMHGSVWNYDTHVPILFSRGSGASRVIHRQVQPVDVAPTLAAILGLSPPAAAVGQVLEEVVE